MQSDSTHVAVGGTLLGLGGAGLFTLLIYAAAPDAHAWGDVWFLALFSLAVLLAALGGYVLAAIYLPFPLPEPRSQREAAASLFIEEVRVDSLRDNAVIFVIGFMNRGFSDIPKAAVNVLVPAFVNELSIVTPDGRRVSGGQVLPTAAILIDEDHKGPPVTSIYWSGSIDFPGRVARPVWFGAILSPLQDLPVKVVVTAMELSAPLEEDFVLSLDGLATRPDQPPVPMAVRRHRRLSGSPGPSG